MTVGTAMLAFVATAQPNLESFKELLSSPPIIEEVRAECRYNGSKPTDYFFGRWQSNAFLLSISTNREGVERGGGPGDLTRLYARVGDQLWTIFGTNRPVKIGFIGSLSSNNELIVATDVASVDLGRLLNCGVEHLKAGQIRWQQNHYSGTNDSHSVIVSGQAYTNFSGVVTGLDMQMSFLTPSAATGKPETYHSQLEYEYDPVVSDRYPSVIKRYVLRPKARFLRDEIHIHSIKLAKTALNPELFAYEPFAYTNSWILYGTNDGFYYVTKGGKTLPVQKASQQAKFSIRMWFIISAGTALLIPAALLHLMKARVNKRSNSAK